MADSIDGIYVKLSVNSDEFVSQMKQCESSVDKAERELSSLESSTKSATSEEKKYGDTVGKATESLKQHASQTERAREQVEKGGNAAEKAASKNHALTDSVKSAIAPLDDVKNAMGAVTGVLGAFGVSVGVSQLIGQIKSLADEAKKARDEVDKLYEGLDYSYSLTDDERGLVRKLSSMQGSQVGYSGDVEDLQKIVGAVSSLNQGLGLDELQALSEEYMYLSEMGVANLDKSVKEATSTFKLFNINGVEEQVSSLEYLREVCQQTLIPLDDLLSIMQDAAAVSKAYGLTFQETASMIGNSALDYGGSISYVSNFVNSYESELDKAIESAKSKIEDNLTIGLDSMSRSAFLEANKETILEQAEADAQAYMQTYSAAFLSAIDTNKFSVGVLDTSKNIILSSRTEEGWKQAHETYQKLEKNYAAVSETKPMYLDQVIRNATGTASGIGYSGTSLDSKFRINVGSLVSANEIGLIPVNEQQSTDILGGKQTSDLSESFKNFADWISEASKAISGFFGISAASAGEVKGLDDNLSSWGDTVGDLPDSLSDLVDKNIIPLNEQLSQASDTLTDINEFTITYNENTYSLLIPACQDETNSVRSLEAAWLAAAAAKEKYMNT